MAVNTMMCYVRCAIYTALPDALLPGYPPVRLQALTRRSGDRSYQLLAPRVHASRLRCLLLKEGATAAVLRHHQGCCTALGIPRAGLCHSMQDGIQQKGKLSRLLQAFHSLTVPACSCSALVVISSQQGGRLKKKAYFHFRGPNRKGGNFPFNPSLLGEFCDRSFGFVTFFFDLGL